MASVDFSSLVGLPYSYMGRGPDSYDCWGLFRLMQAGRGLVLPVWDGAADPCELSAAAAVRVAGTSLAWRVLEAPVVLEPYDAVLMEVRGRWHIGGLIGPGAMLHMPREKTSVIEPIHRYRHVIREFLRHP